MALTNLTPEKHSAPEIPGSDREILWLCPEQADEEMRRIDRLQTAAIQDAELMISLSRLQRALSDVMRAITARMERNANGIPANRT